MKKHFAFILIILLLGSSNVCTGEKAQLTVKADARVELMSLIFRLAGNPEYNRGILSSYNKAVMNHFGRFKNHEAVKLAAELRKNRGISYDAVMSMAVFLSESYVPGEKLPPVAKPGVITRYRQRPKGLEKRWTLEDARRFQVAVQMFVKDTGFNRFIKSRKPFYRQTAKRLRSLMNKYRIGGWLDGFFGKLPRTRFYVIPGMLNGPASYAANIRYENGEAEYYCILGVNMSGKDGLPFFGPGVATTVVHEFCHNYVNPLVDAPEVAEQLSSAGKKMYSLVAEKMKSQAYSNWKTMIYESLVRAAVNRYLQANDPGSVKEDIQSNIERGFFWIRDLVEVLAEYEANREKYPTFRKFMGRIVGFFKNYSKKAGDILAAKEKDWRDKLEHYRAKGPKIVAMTPANGARDVDPGLKMITLTFDRVMRDRSWSVVTLDKNFPPLAGEAYYGKERKTFYLPVKVEPGKTYRFGLNNEKWMNFKGEDGIPLAPLLVEFTTRQVPAAGNSK